MLILSQTHLTEIQEHGVEAYPYECCGAMLGSQKGEEKETQKIIRIENTWDSDTETKHRRFAITAQDYKELEAFAKQEKLALLGFYHTHPDHPAQPSQTDLNYAWPFFSYIILAVSKGKAAEINSFVLDLDKNIFVKEELKI